MRSHDLARSERKAGVGEVFGFAVVYVALGLFSLQTAFIQTNTAAFWVPTGYSVGLLIVRGRRMWPAVALGALVLNGLANLRMSGDVSLVVKLLVAVAVAAGNTGEALLARALATRYADGASFTDRIRHVLSFALVVVPLPPLVSATVGVGASQLGGLIRHGQGLEVLVTWYTANATGLVIFTGPFILLLGNRFRLRLRHRRFEALALALCLVFAEQAVCGIYFAHWLRSWPRTYMVIPLLLWATFRFGPSGAMLSSIVVALVAVVGTMRGFSAFPAATPSQSLLLLQVFLALLSVMTLSISAGVSEVQSLSHSLASEIVARNGEIRRLEHRHEVFTRLVAHDLQGPLLEVRNALRATSQAVKSDEAIPAEVASALTMMDETCTALASRVAQMLSGGEGECSESPTESPRLSTIFDRIAAAHDLSPSAAQALLKRSGDMGLRPRRPQEVERILHTLVDNAFKYGPRGSPIEVAAFKHGFNLEITVTDKGSGLDADDLASLFRTQLHNGRGRTGSGLGLFLASEQARAIEGRLSYIKAHPHGASFRLVLPA